MEINNTTLKPMDAVDFSKFSKNLELVDFKVFFSCLNFLPHLKKRVTIGGEALRKDETKK